MEVRDGGTEPTPMGDQGDARTLQGDPGAREQGGRGTVLPGSVHAVGARGDGAPLGGGAPAGAGAALSGDRGANGRVDDDGDTRGALAAPRRRRLPAGARPNGLLRVAVPVKGRLRDSSFKLLEDAGLGPEQPGERALAFPCRNAPVEVLLVRAADVPEYVQDGVVDCGITGLDLIRERGADVHELVRLGFGSCRLEAAVPEESRVRAIEELAGATVATVEPRRHRYLMLNVPESALAAICELVAPRAPSVVPLAEPGLVAVHVLVPSDDVWRLLP